MVYIQIFLVCPVSISALIFWASSLLGAGLQGELEHPLPGPDCLVATRVPLVFLSLFSLVFKENLQSFFEHQGFRYMPGASL